MEFNTQICTTREQSERLLSMGLNPETADMNWAIKNSDREGNEYSVKYMSIGQGDYQLLHPNWYIPAWSLHRLIAMFTNSVSTESDVYILNTDNTYDAVIDDIEWCVNKGYFNKQYLKR